MTEAQITVGARVGPFQVLSADPSGKRIAVACQCGASHTVGVDALLTGAATCPAVNAIGHKSRP
jgi:hypothetical protein